MKILDKDYNNYDYLTVSAKAERVKEIIESYSTLGWELLKTSDDKQYADLDIVDFRRPHRIENKDRLQYLQVRLETLLNRMGVLEHKRGSKSRAMGMSGGILGCLCIAFGISLFIVEPAVAAYIGAGVLIALGIAMFAVVATCYKRVAGMEMRESAVKLAEVRDDIGRICAEAASLSGLKTRGGEEQA